MEIRFTAFREDVQKLFPLITTLHLNKTVSFELFGDDVAYTTTDINHIDERGAIFGAFR